MMRNPGRIRLRLAKRLNEVGIKVDPADLWTQDGFYRNRHHDLARWGSNHAEYRGRKVSLTSWDTMTDCGRHGVEIVNERDPLILEISRKE